MQNRVPLAWLNLTHDVKRLAVGVAGVGFAVLLMFAQTGFQNALLDSTVQVFEDLEADIILVNRAQISLPAQQRFSRQRVIQARRCPGVAGAYPVYVQTIGSVLQSPGQKGYPIRVLAFQLGDPVFRYADIGEHSVELRSPGTALYDRKSALKFGVPLDEEEMLRHTVELAGKQLRLVGHFQLGADFANDGNVLMSADNFARYFPLRAAGDDPLSLIDLGVIQCEPDADVYAVQRELQAILPNDVSVLTRREMIVREREFWNDSTPVGYMFTVGMMMGFMVGVIICYQIIHADITDHMPEFATLRAMGYPNRYFLFLVVSEALYLSLLGFFPGLLASWLLYQWLASARGLLMILNLPRASFVLMLTIAMCTISGFLVMRKVLEAEPAELFK